MAWSRAYKTKHHRSVAHVNSYLSHPPSPSDASCEMLFPPALALLAVVFNFCALLHLTNNRNGLSTSRWYTLHALEESTATAYANHLDIVSPPPPTPSPIYSPALRHAEWVYRSSAVRILDFVDGSGKVRTVSDVGSPPLLPQSPPSPTKSTDPVASAGLLPPTLTSPSYPATLEPFPTRVPSTASGIASPVARFLGLMGFFSCFVYAAIFAWLKVRSQRLSRLSLSLSMP